MHLRRFYLIRKYFKTFPEQQVSANLCTECGKNGRFLLLNFVFKKTDICSSTYLLLLSLFFIQQALVFRENCCELFYIRIQPILINEVSVQSRYSQNELHLPQFITVLILHLECSFCNLRQNFDFNFTVVFNIFKPKAVSWDVITLTPIGISGWFRWLFWPIFVSRFLF